MGFSKDVIDYVAEHYRHASTTRLAVRLRLSHRELKRILRTNGFVRTPDEIRWIQEHPDWPLPTPGKREILPLARPDWLCGLLVFVMTLAVYLLTVAPTVVGEDSGELIAAADELGIAHPPGYPIWCLAGKLFTLLIPFGDIGYRVNCVSAFFGALTAAGVTLVVALLVRNRLAAIAAGLLMAFSTALWSQAVIAEVYTLNSFFLVLMLFLLFYWQKTRDFFFLCGICYLYGLSLTNHSTMAPLGVVFAIYIIYYWPAALLSPRVGLLLLAFFLLGVSIYLYLPIRSTANPFMDWGDPEGPQMAIRHIMRKAYTEGEQVSVHSWGRYVGQLWQVFHLYGSQFTWVLAPLPLVGCLVAFRRSRAHTLFLLSLFLLLTVAMTYYANFDISREGAWIARPFYIPAYLIAAIWIGYALSAVRGVLERVRWSFVRQRAGYAVVALPVLSLLAHWNENDYSGYYYASDFGHNVLRTVRPDSILLPSADHACFPLIYLHGVLRIRPDVVVADKYGYLEKRFLRTLARDEDDLARAEKLRKTDLYRWIVERAPGYVYFTSHPNVSSFPGHRMRSVGLLYEVAPSWAPISQEYEASVWDKYVWRNREGDTRAHDYSAALYHADRHFAYGRFLLVQGKLKEAALELDRAAEYAYGLKEYFNNLGSALGEHGAFAAARRQFLRALALDSDYPLSLQNLAKACMSLERYDEAAEALERLLKNTPPTPPTLHDLALAYEKAGRPYSAYSTYRQLAALTPRDPVPFVAMAKLAWGSLKDKDTARALFRHALSLNPYQPELAKLFQKERELHDLLAFVKTRDPLDDEIHAVDRGSSIPPHGPSPKAASPAVRIPTPPVQALPEPPGRITP